MNKITFSAPKKEDYVDNKEELDGGSVASDDEIYQDAADPGSAAARSTGSNLGEMESNSEADDAAAAADIGARFDTNEQRLRARFDANAAASSAATTTTERSAATAGLRAATAGLRAATLRADAAADIGARFDTNEQRLRARFDANAAASSAAATTTTERSAATAGLRAATAGLRAATLRADAALRAAAERSAAGPGSVTERSAADSRSVTDRAATLRAAAPAAPAATTTPATERPATDRSVTAAPAPGDSGTERSAAGAAAPGSDHSSREPGTGSAAVPTVTAATLRPGPGTAAAGLRAATTENDHTLRSEVGASAERRSDAATDPAAVPTVPAANPGEEELKFLEDLARTNGYSSFVDCDFILTINHKNDAFTYNYKGFNDAGNYIDVQPSRDRPIYFFSNNNLKLTDEKNYLYRESVTDYLFGLLPDDIKTKIDSSSSSSDGSCNEGLKAQKTMEYAVLLSPYSACQHGVTIEQRTDFMGKINAISDADDKISLLKFLEDLSSNHVAEENKEIRNLSFKANDEIYFDHSRGKDVASAPQESGRVFAENKFNEFKKKAEALPAEGVSDSSIAPTDYVEFHKIENYFDDKELQGGAGEGKSKDESRTAVVFFHANKNENSQTVISGEAVKKLTKVAKEYCKFIGYSVSNHFPAHSDLSGEELLKDLKDNYKQISTGFTIPKPVSTEKLLKYLHDDGVKNYDKANEAEVDELLKSRPEIYSLIAGLVNFKIANDFLECKIESQEQPKNKGLGSANPTENFLASNKKIGTDYGQTDAKSDLEFAFGKKPFCELEPQYHSMKNIFQAGISIRRDKEHPHLVDIVRVITPDEDQAEVKKPNIQFVAIKGQGDDDGKITLSINKEGSIADISDRVFFRKVELQDNGEVSFDDKIYYYDNDGIRQSLEIKDIQGDNKEAFLNNLGALKIRATCVVLDKDNQPTITKSKFSALGNDNIFKNYDIPKDGGRYTPEIADSARSPGDPGAASASRSSPPSLRRGNPTWSETVRSVSPINGVSRDGR